MATNGCAEISEHRAPLEAVQDALSKLSAGRHEFEEFLTDLFDRWRDLREQCALLERERAMLQAQLEAAGRHHAGLAATLAAQQRRNARLQTRWTTELRRLRRLLEGQVPPQSAAGEPLPPAPLTDLGPVPGEGTQAVPGVSG
ncbi:MAG: hypothetical protein ACLQLG_18800 [Thermoguttaceae bacterium]